MNGGKGGSPTPGGAAADSGQSLYEVIRDQLIEEIEQGRAYPAGALLPSIREITVNWTVSTTTARKVLAELGQAGYAKSEGTRGFVSLGPKAGRLSHDRKDVPEEARPTDEGVRHHREDEAPDLVIRETQVVSLGRDAAFEGVIGDVRTERAPAEVALALRLPTPSPPLVVRRDVAYDEHDTPVQLRTSYLLPEIAEGTPLAAPGVIDGPWPVALKRHSGREALISESQITARHPTDAECMALRLQPMACVLVRTDVTNDESGKQIDFTSTVWPGESIRIAVPLGDAP